MSGKAASAIRRGGVRIRSLGSGHTPLNLVISELSSVRQQLKDSIAAQQRASDAQKKWGEDDDIPALRDILTALSEVQLMWIEAQKEYLASLKEYKFTYERILESEKKLDSAKKQLATYEEKEKKYDKELSKGSKDPENAQRKLKMYSDAKELAEAEVYGQDRETLAKKFVYVKSGLLDHAKAWATLGRVCTKFAESQKNLALLLPDVTPQDDGPPAYTGSRQSKAILRDLRASLANGSGPEYQSSLPYQPSMRPPSSRLPDPPTSRLPDPPTSRLPDPPTSRIPNPPSFKPPVLSKRPQIRRKTSGDDNDSFDSFDED